MRLLLRFVLLVICACALGCEPLGTDAPLLEAHRGGVVSQTSLSGDRVASSPLVVESPQAPNEAEAGQALEASAPVGRSTDTPGQEVLPALLQGDVDSSAEDSADSQETSSSLATAEQLAPELSSGEYGGGAIVVQQASASLAASVDDTAAVPEDSANVVEGEAELEAGRGENQRQSGAASVVSSEPEPLKRDVDEFSPALVGGETLSVELDRVIPEGPSSDESALAVLDALPRRSLRTSPQQTQDCIPAGSGLLGLSLGQLSMVRAWLDGTLLRAELRGPDGRLYTVVRGDRVGADGGRVLQVSSAQVVVGEIGFGLDGNPFIVQEAIR